MVYLRILLFLFIIPALTGTAVSYKLLKLYSITKITIFKVFPIGYLTVWAILEIISIPVTILKLPFTVDLLITWAAVLALSASGLVIIFGKNAYKTRIRNDLDSLKKTGITDWLFILLFAAVLGFLIYKIYYTVFYDADDSRFVVEAVDILKDNRILASDPVTGLPLTSNFHDFHKDLVSQWAAFLAMGGVLIGKSPTIFAHTVYPVIAILILVCLVHMILDITLEKKDISVIFPSLTFLLIVITFGYYTFQSSERFILSRVWQGKASLAGIGICAIILSFLYIHESIGPKGKLREGSKPSFRLFALLLISNTALCFMSSMGVILGASLITAYGTVTAASRRSFKILILSALCCAPNFVLFALDRLYTIQIYLGDGV